MLQPHHLRNENNAGFAQHFTRNPHYNTTASELQPPYCQETTRWSDLADEVLDGPSRVIKYLQDGERETAWVTCPPKCWTKSCCQVADKGKRGLGAVYVKPTSREPAPYHSKEVSRTVREVAAAVHWWCICCSHDHITTDDGIYSSMMCSLLSVHMAVLPA